MKLFKILLLVGLVSSCSTDEVLRDVAGDDSCLLAYIATANSASRIEIGETLDGVSKLVWTKGDSFAAYNERNKASTYTLIGEGKSASGKFETSTDDFLPVRALYPAYMAEGTDGMTMTLGLPNEYAADMNTQNAPMCGKVNDGKVYFSHLCVMLKVDLSGYAGAYDKIYISADRPIAGRWSFDTTKEEDAELTPDGMVKNEVYVYRKSGQNVFYLPLPSGKYEYINISACNGEEHKSVAAIYNKVLKRGYIYTARFRDMTGRLEPFTQRVNVQTEIAKPEQIIDDEWVAIGVGLPHSLNMDYYNPYNGRPSYRFELKEDDNHLEGYGGDSKGRVEMSYCYATEEDYQRHPEVEYWKQQIVKTVYHLGKGQCKQGAKMSYRFSVMIPDDISTEVHTIFAQWHGMPSRTLVQTPEGVVKTITVDEFLELDKRMDFKKDTGYDKGSKEPNGWKIEQGGYPPMAFGITDGYFYIQANSDKKWMSDKNERCNINPVTSEIMDVRYSTQGYKSSTLAYKLPMSDFPKNTWVSFEVNVDWSVYVMEKNELAKTGMLDVYMGYSTDKGYENKHIVDHQPMDIGRNDDSGYYFKFGIYRTSGNVIPLHYNLAGYSECERKD